MPRRTSTYLAGATLCAAAALTIGLVTAGTGSRRVVPATLSATAATSGAAAAASSPGTVRVALRRATTSASSAQPVCAAGTTVETTSGSVCGLDVSGDDEWLGIPYAAPPVGALRWKPPQTPTPWTTTLQATSFGSPCTQDAPSLFGSENCLYLNVWRPSGTAPQGGLPVLVHIHGGGFGVGDGEGGPAGNLPGLGLTGQDSTVMANAGNEIIVAMNYRLGVFGFLSDPTLGPNSGDYGLEDQQAAMRWVKKNIADFGGDPRNVTIFGESAGGSSVCDQIASPTAAGLFEKAVSVSGEYSPLFATTGGLATQDCKSAPPTQQQAARAGADFVSAVGCASAAQVAACLRAVPASQVMAAETAGAGNISPTINGTTLTMSLRQALRTGHVNRVPVIAGNDRDEDLIGSPTTASQYVQLVDQMYGRFAPAVLALYPTSRFYSPFVAFRTVAADSATVCPALQTDRDLARWMPVYGYEIDAGDARDNAGYSEPTPTTPTGSGHVYSWFVGVDPSQLDANQLVLQQQEISAVNALARTGNPNASMTPLWPQFHSTGQIMSWAPGGDSETISVRQIEADHNCGFWDRITPNQ